MSNEAWDCLYLYFNQLEKVYASIVALQTDQQPTPLSEDEDNHCQEDASKMTSLAFLPLHEELISSIAFCHQNISAYLSENEWEYLQCALIFHCDETVLTQTLERKANIKTKKLQFKAKWPTLQKQLLECRDGGERFFSKLDELLTLSSEFPVAIETYYFCLKQGFKGQYLYQPERLEHYLKRCSKVMISNMTEQKSQATLRNKDHSKSEPKIGGMR
jgi:type VI protein secretion system component VasF